MTRSIQKNTEIEDEAYRVVEATNEDGTIDGEVLNKPYRDEDELVIEVCPLIPNMGSEQIRLKWPTKDDSSYKAVRLAREEVGGFAAISQLKNETVKLRETEDGFEIVVPDEDKYKIDNSILHRFHIFIITLGFLGSFVAAAVPFILLFLLPFGISVLTFYQGLSITIGSLIMLVALAAYMDTVLDI